MEMIYSSLLQETLSESLMWGPEIAIYLTCL